MKFFGGFGDKFLRFAFLSFLKKGKAGIGKFRKCSRKIHRSGAMKFFGGFGDKFLRFA